MLSFIKKNIYPCLDAVGDGAVRSINLHGEIKPGVPAADLVSVIEDVTEAIVDHIAELNINILRPKLSKARPRIKFQL